MAHVISNACIECGDCVDPCPTQCIYEDSPYVIEAQDCIDCGVCIGYCPVGAISAGTTPPPPDAIVCHLKSGTVDLNTKLCGRGTSTKRANVGIKIHNGQDLSDLFYSISQGGTVGPTLGFKTGSTDIASLFAKKGSV